MVNDFVNEQILLHPVPQYLVVEKKNYVDPDQPANVVLRSRPTASFHKYMLFDREVSKSTLGNARYKN